VRLKPRWVFVFMIYYFSQFIREYKHEKESPEGAGLSLIYGETSD